MWGSVIAVHVSLFWFFAFILSDKRMCVHMYAIHKLRHVFKKKTCGCGPLSPALLDCYLIFFYHQMCSFGYSCLWKRVSLSGNRNQRLRLQSGGGVYSGEGTLHQWVTFFFCFRSKFCCALPLTRKVEQRWRTWCGGLKLLSPWVCSIRTTVWLEMASLFSLLLFFFFCERSCVLL